MITLLDGIAERGSPMYYNFVRIHKSLRVTPAMAAGVTDRLWELEDIVKLSDWEKNNATVIRNGI